MFRQRLHPLTFTGAAAAAVLIAYLALWMGDPDINPHAKMFAVLIVLSTISVMCVFVGVIRQSVRSGVLREARRDAAKVTQLKTHMDVRIKAGFAELSESLPAVFAATVERVLRQPGPAREALVAVLADVVVQKTSEAVAIRQRHGGDNIGARLAVLERTLADSARRASSGHKMQHNGVGSDAVDIDDIIAQAEFRGYLQRRRDEGDEGGD